MITVQLDERLLPALQEIVEAMQAGHSKKIAQLDAAAQGFPREIPAYGGHIFRSQQELDVYEAALAIRDANLANPANWQGTYTGTIDPDTLTLYDHAYLSQRHDLWPRVGQIFTKNPIPRDRTTGYVYTAGDLATVDVSQYAANGGILATV